jgi:hypothetical protein
MTLTLEEGIFSFSITPFSTPSLIAITLLATFLAKYLSI